ncbi:unnamed protein product [Calicophoron daubneyi]|uniref:protein-tyrosine-phosphatase n=1 Tax=Calicophoron daubneyi TaxID=300641 RepID=A0AAV2SZ13_CALDB
MSFAEPKTELCVLQNQNRSPSVVFLALIFSVLCQWLRLKVYLQNFSTCLFETVRHVQIDWNIKILGERYDECLLYSAKEHSSSGRDYAGGYHECPEPFCASFISIIFHDPTPTSNLPHFPLCLKSLFSHKRSWQLNVILRTLSDKAKWRVKPPTPYITKYHGTCKHIPYLFYILFFLILLPNFCVGWSITTSIPPSSKQSSSRTPLLSFPVEDGKVIGPFSEPVKSAVGVQDLPPLTALSVDPIPTPSIPEHFMTNSSERRHDARKATGLPDPYNGGLIKRIRRGLKPVIENNDAGKFVISPAGNNKSRSTELQLSVGFACAVGSIFLALLLTLLAFWCVSRRHRQKAPSDGDNSKEYTSGLVSPTSPPSISKTQIPESNLKSVKPKLSIALDSSTSSPPSAQIAAQKPVQETDKNNFTHLLKPCYFCFDCCASSFRSEHEKAAADELDPITNSPKLDLPIRNFPTGKSNSLPRSTRSTSLNQTQVRSAPQSVTNLKRSGSTGSPSLATRRHVALPPSLLTNMPSIVTPSPTFETRAVQIQLQKSPFVPYVVPEQPTTQPFSEFPGRNNAPKVIGTPEEAGSTQSTTLPAVIQLSPFSPVPNSSKSDPLTSSSPSDVKGVGVSSRIAVKLDPSAPATSAVRSRTKGLLESRRGSHTSLTLSLSPSVDLPSTCSVSIPTSSLDPNPDIEVATTGRSAGSDIPISTLLGACEQTAGVCYSAHSTCSQEQASGYFEPDTEMAEAQLSGGLQRSANSTGTSSPLAVYGTTTQSPLSSHHPSVITSHRGYGEPCNPYVQRVLHSSCYHHCRCRHHHHPACHCRSEQGFPCPYGNPSHQRSHDLDQLLNNSQPLTCEKLSSKLKENTTFFSEFWNIPMNLANKKDLPIPGVGQKNRYQSILPNYSTRVVLPMVNNDLATTYINANYIRGYNDRPNAFIATQGPMSHTVNDFWLMVWHSHAPAIVMITKLVEKREVKCELYLPNTLPEDPAMATVLADTPVSSTSRTGSSFASSSPLSSASPSASTSDSCAGSRPSSARALMTVASRSSDSGATSLGEDKAESVFSAATGASAADHQQQQVKLAECTSQEANQIVAPPMATQTFGDIKITVEDMEEFEGFTVRHLLLQRKQEERRVSHFWYTAWPDHSSPETTPASARQLLQLVQAAEACRRQSHRGVSSKASSAASRQPQEEAGAAPISVEHDVSAAKSPATSSDEGGPIIVHCSAGLGRTGCFIALCIGCEQLQAEGCVDVLRIVSRLRLDRGGMVQTHEQYEFIHHALATFPSFWSGRPLPPGEGQPDPLPRNADVFLSPDP